MPSITKRSIATVRQIELQRAHPHRNAVLDVNKTWELVAKKSWRPVWVAAYYNQSVERVYYLLRQHPHYRSLMDERGAARENQRKSDGVSFASMLQMGLNQKDISEITGCSLSMVAYAVKKLPSGDVLLNEHRADRSGPNHWAYDNTVRTLYHLSSKTFTGTRQEFIREQGQNAPSFASSVCMLVAGTTQFCSGWSLTKPTQEEIDSYVARAVTLHHFFHGEREMSVFATREGMNTLNHLNQDESKRLVEGLIRSSRGWRLASSAHAASGVNAGHAAKSRRARLYAAKLLAEVEALKSCNDDRTLASVAVALNQKGLYTPRGKAWTMKLLHQGLSRARRLCGQ